MNKTETPLTDKEAFSDHIMPEMQSVPVGFARRLERERGELMRGLDELLQEIDNLEGVEYTRNIEPYKAESVWSCTLDRARVLLERMKEGKWPTNPQEGKFTGLLHINAAVRPMPNCVKTSSTIAGNMAQIALNYSSYQ